MVVRPMGFHDVRWRWVGLAVALGFGVAAGPARGATVSGFSPEFGPAGTEVVVSGTGLSTATFVYFGGTEAAGEILARSATAVRARVPPNALTGPISVFTSASGAGSSAQVFIAAPRVESVEPWTGAPGAQVTISGANLGTGLPGGRGAVSNVLFNGVRAPFQVVGINQLVTRVPTNSGSGPITLANLAGTFTTFRRFEVPAVIAAFTPVGAQPGEPIEVRGQNLDGAVRVEVGLEPARFVANSVTNLTFWVPTNAVNGRLQITTAAGITATASNVVVRPRVVRFSPEAGTSGTQVVLEGGGLNGVTEVAFNGTRATYAPRSSTRIDALVPAGAESGPIRVSTTNGVFTTAGDFHLPGRITSVSPLAGRRGDTVTVEGQNLRGATTVRLNGVTTSFTVVSGTRLTFEVPAAATTGRVTVETPAGEVLSATTFTVRPVLDGFQPGNGGVGTPFQLLGAGLTNLTWVRLGGLDASHTVVNSTQVRVLVPVGAFSGTVRVRTLDGQETETTGNFFVDGARPTLNAFAPADGLPGTRVVLTGAGFRTASRVQFNGTDATFTVRSPAEIETSVPFGATTGTIAVTTLDGIAVSAGEFTVGRVEVQLTATPGVGVLNLRWPQAATGFVLESSPRLESDAPWQAVGQVPVAEGDLWRVAVVLPQTGSRYFRLKK